MSPIALTAKVRVRRSRYSNFCAAAEHGRSRPSGVAKRIVVADIRVEHSAPKV